MLNNFQLYLLNPLFFSNRSQEKDGSESDDDVVVIYDNAQASQKRAEAEHSKDKSDLKGNYLGITEPVASVVRIITTYNYISVKSTQL